MANEGTVLLTHNVLCIGNAIVDIIARVDDQFLVDHSRVKASMLLVDAEASRKLYSVMPPAIERSGGSAANTAAGVASFGGTARYFGKIRNDQLGDVFRHDITAAGVSFESSAATGGEDTATSMILVTPDAQRTMNTYLGACRDLGPDDMIEEQVAAAEVTYVEGYLWDRPSAKQAVVKAMDLAHKYSRLVSLSLSDSFCVDRFRDEFRSLVEERVDILFANEEEIMSLYQVDTIDEALELLNDHVRIAAITRSEHGSVIVTKDDKISVEAVPVTVKDTTGAGDLYAAGFLFGFTNNRSLMDCAKLGSLAAGEVISHLGARPEVSLQDLARQKGLLD